MVVDVVFTKLFEKGVLYVGVFGHIYCYLLKCLSINCINQRFRSSEEVILLKQIMPFIESNAKAA